MKIYPISDFGLKNLDLVNNVLKFCKLNNRVKKYRDMVYGYFATCLTFPNDNLPFSKEVNDLFCDFKQFDYWTQKSWNIYKKSDKNLKSIFKSHNAVYPNNQIKFYYKPNQISMNGKFSPNDLENRLSYSFLRYSLTKEYECNEVFSFDTETYKGKCKLIARNENGSKVVRNYILNPTFDDCLKFLIYHINSPNVYRFYFNIDFDISAILKLYPNKDNLLFMDKISKGIVVKYVSKKNNHTYTLKWIRKRMFSIRVDGRKKRDVVFTDLYPFYNMGLGKASHKYLGYGKNKINGEKLNTDLNYWKKKERKIIKYCIKDCELTKKLAEILINKIKELGLKLPKYLCSPASLSKQNFRFNNYISSLKHTPIKIIQTAFNTYFGGRFEILKRGFFNEVYLYDIVSQYPSFIKNLPNISNGYWEIFKNLKELPKEQCLGYFKAYVKIPMSERLPTLPIKKKNLVVFPNGTILGYFTWYDLDLMRKYIISIKKAYIFQYKSKDENKPFFNKINELVDKKRQINKKKDGLGYNIVKICMNGLYGCFIEKHENYLYNEQTKEFHKRFKAGLLFNPIFASQITAFGRWSVIKDIPKYKRKNIIGIHTDSIITDFDCSKYLKIEKTLGNWNLENHGRGVIIGTGIYQIDKKKKKKLRQEAYLSNLLKIGLNYLIKINLKNLLFLKLNI